MRNATRGREVGQETPKQHREALHFGRRLGLRVQAARLDVEDSGSLDTRYLTTVGVAEGWHCLELGGGSGSIAEWLTAQVGASGSVTAIDINPVLSTCSLQRTCRCRRWTCARARIVIGAGQLDAATIDAASALLDDPNYWTQCWMMTAVWVRKPPDGGGARVDS
jgi:hypothetical protein